MIPQPDSEPEATTAEIAKVVTDKGWSFVGVLDQFLTRRLLRAVDEVATRSADGRQLHQLSGLAQHPDLAAIVDWPPLLTLAVELLSPNVYINHSHLDVHAPHPSTGAHRWHRDNGLMGRDMRLLWRDQPRVTLKVAVFDARVWHRRRDNLGTRTRRAVFMAYSYRWLTSRDIPLDQVPAWANLAPIPRQLLGDQAVDPFYWDSGELPLNHRSTDSKAR